MNPNQDTELAWANYDVNMDTIDGKDTLHAIVGICYQNMPDATNKNEPNGSLPVFEVGEKEDSLMGKERENETYYKQIHKARFDLSTPNTYQETENVGKLRVVDFFWLLQFEVETPLPLHQIPSARHCTLYYQLTRHQSSLLQFFHHIKPHTNMSTPNSQGLPTALTVISANIEGLPSGKASMLSVMCKDKHRGYTQARPRIPGMSFVAECPHNKYGSAVFIRDDLKVKGISICEEDDVELITIQRCNAIIQSVYKPPNKQFLLPQLQQGNKPHVVIGDFNSHNTLWGYPTTGTDGQAVEQWAESSNLSLIHDAKLPK